MIKRLVLSIYENQFSVKITRQNTALPWFSHNTKRRLLLKFFEYQPVFCRFAIDIVNHKEITLSNRLDLFASFGIYPDENRDQGKKKRTQ